ncbi:MAG: bifunctional lysine ketoglutarate reductase /saccharopine dehydrogenase family protein [Ignavibacteriaceae bacterium]|nr:bifunctional lysine ketoglutarate reductase /saccharopine dehydrogenase family protein [Ignavibacteriaceae bacterium]MCW8960540.1 bifunctional lysine ketoglutarate reductase /saccharopine dehydrogenase family protein [Ignavibacteriaceae bacterium]
MIIGIRRADKNKWERRTPLIPDDLKYLKEKYGIQTLVQPSEIRAYTNAQYKEAGVEVVEDIQNVKIIFAVKEIPLHFYRERKTYIFFSHTIKGQSYNMPLLKKMMELKCNLIDYERIVDESNRRLIFFGKYAGLAGMVETLHALGQKLKLKGYKTPLEKIKQAYQYDSIEEVKQELKKIGEEIKSGGIPEDVQPLIIGFAGYGNVSKGSQEIIDILPIILIQPDELQDLSKYSKEEISRNLFKVVFKEEDLVKPKEGIFKLQDYYDNPEKYEGKFEEYIPYLTVLVNCIYWTNRYPRLVTKEYLRSENYLNSDQKLLVIGDISVDVNGAIEITYKATDPGNAFYTYQPDNDKFEDSIKKEGITIMAVDNLPCEFPKESSKEFSSILKNYVYEIVNEDFNKSFEELSLSNPIKKALILQNGELTKDYQYLKKYLNKV